MKRTKRNGIARDLKSPKYHQRIVADKRRKLQHRRRHKQHGKTSGD